MGALRVLKLTGAAALGTAAVAGCGNAQHFANIPRPPVPIDLTVYVNDNRVSVSPASIGAGPVVFFVTNAADASHDVAIRSLTGSGTLSSTGSIDSGQPAQLQVNMTTGSYHIDAGDGIAPATLTVGKSRPNANNVLLQP